MREEKTVPAARDESSVEWGSPGPKEAPVPELRVGQLVRPNTLVQQMAVVDGIGSSGKSMMCHVLASMERGENQRQDLLFDTALRLYRMGISPYFPST